MSIIIIPVIKEYVIWCYDLTVHFIRKIVLVNLNSVRGGIPKIIWGENMDSKIRLNKLFIKDLLYTWKLEIYLLLFNL